jgi:hypothetical protein
MPLRVTIGITINHSISFSFKNTQFKLNNCNNFHAIFTHTISVQQRDVKYWALLQEGKMKQLNYCHRPTSAWTADDLLTAKYKRQ